MIEGGFLLCPRRSMGSDPLWTEQPFDRWRARWDLIQSAAYHPRSRVVGNQLLTEERGEVLASLRFLAERWGWSQKRVRGFLGLLCEMGTIRAQRRTSLGHIYAIEKYDTYQLQGQTKGTAGAHLGQSEGTAGAQLGHGSGTARTQAGHSSGEQEALPLKPPRRAESRSQAPFSSAPRQDAQDLGESAEIVPMFTRLRPSLSNGSEASGRSAEALERLTGTSAVVPVSGMLRPAWWRTAGARVGRRGSSQSRCLSGSTGSLASRLSARDAAVAGHGSGTAGAQLGHSQGTGGARERAQRIDKRDEREEEKLAAASRVRARRRRSMEFETSAVEFLGRRLSSGELELVEVWERRYGPCVLRLGFERAQERRLNADPGWSPPLSYLTPILRELLEQHLKTHPELSEDVEEDRAAALADLAELELPDPERERFRRGLEGAQDCAEVADLLEAALEMASRLAPEKGVAHG